jgi:Flp pilus assembly protein TadB
MKRVLERSGMWIVVVGFVIVGLGLVVLIATENAFFYALGWVVVLIGGGVLFWSVLRDRLRARKTEDLDDVGFN